MLVSLISKCLEKHVIVKNKFIKISVQKGCIEKVPSCWEHMSVVWVALKKTQFNKLNVANIWLDIANVYGSIRRRLIGALKKAPCNKLNVANLWLDTANVCGSIQHRLIFFTLKKNGAHEH